jgi:hypothetical protein
LGSYKIIHCAEHGLRETRAEAGNLLEDAAVVQATDAWPGPRIQAMDVDRRG